MIISGCLDTGKLDWERGRTGTCTTRTTEGRPCIRIRISCSTIPCWSGSSQVSKALPRPPRRMKPWQHGRPWHAWLCDEHQDRVATVAVPRSPHPIQQLARGKPAANGRPAGQYEYRVRSWLPGRHVRVLYEYSSRRCLAGTTLLGAAATAQYLYWRRGLWNTIGRQLGCRWLLAAPCEPVQLTADGCLCLPSAVSLLCSPFKSSGWYKV